MKKRIAKKMANRYLNNPKGSYLPYGIYTEGFQAYTDERPAVIKTYARFPYMVKKIIRDKAASNGWDGCHWDDPLLIFVDDIELQEWEKRNEIL